MLRYHSLLHASSIIELKNMNKEKPQKKKRRWIPRMIYLLFLIASIIYVSNAGGAFSYALFFAAVLYPPMALLYLLYIRATVRLGQDLPFREIRKGTEEPYRLTVENAGWLPASGMMLHGETGTFFRDDMTGKQMAFLPREKKVFETRMSCTYAGSYEAGIAGITFRDCFGLIRLTLKNPNPFRMQVLPVMNTTAANDMDRVIWEMVHGAPGHQKDKENTLGVDLARYAPGDPLKRIHWKNYARSGELFIRLQEERDVDLLTVALFAIPGDPEEAAKTRLARRDHFLEYAVSVAGVLAEQRQPVQFLFYTSGIRRVLVEDLEGMQELCRELSREFQLRDEATDVEERLRQEALRLDSVTLLIKEGEDRLCLM